MEERVTALMEETPKRERNPKNVEEGQRGAAARKAKETRMLEDLPKANDSLHAKEEKPSSLQVSQEPPNSRDPIYMA